MSEFLDAALRYASEFGWKVFPLSLGQKVPLPGSHGVKDATADPEQIRTWWKKWPDANIGLACGEASGVYVIDVDVSASGDVNGLESLKALPELPGTVRQDTPRGGFHAFYTATDPPANRNSFRPGIDIRCNGYYVVLAPSIHPNGGRYAWAPGCAPWDRQPAAYPDFMRPVTKAPWAAPQTPAPEVRPEYRPGDSDLLERARLYLEQCEPAVQGCGGHDRLFWAASAMTWGLGLTDDQAYDLLAREYNPRCTPSWNLADAKDEKDFRRKITESRKNPPSKPQFWIRDDPAYVPLAPEHQISKEDIQALIDHAKQTQTPAAAEPNPARPSDLIILTRPTGLLGELCSWINATAIREQPFLTLACSLSFLGALFGRKIKDQTGNRTNIYCMGVAPSSSGKAHAINAIRRLCFEAGCIDLLGGDSIASDSSIERRMDNCPATFFLWDEIGHLLCHIKSGKSAHHAQVVAMLMKLYSAAGSVYSGKEYAEDGKQRTIVQPCCCIYGTSTPERFAEGLSKIELQDGWLSRCLVFMSNTTPPKSRGRDESPVPSGLIEQVAAWAEREIGPAPGEDILSFHVSPNYEKMPPRQLVVPATPEAEAAFIEFDFEATDRGKVDPQLACLWAKAEENARRIALIVAGGESFDNPIITLPIADYSCKLVRKLLLDFSVNVVPEIVCGETDRNKRKIISVIGEAGVDGCIKSDVTKKTQWLKGNERNAMIADLIEANEIISQKKDDGKGLFYWTLENFQRYMTKGRRAQ